MTAHKPNILLITVDQWSAHRLGCAGHPIIQTPTIDTLARAGVRFTNAYSECPVCIPARRSLMTGSGPRQHGDRSFQPTLPMPADMPTLAGTLRAAGYHTASIGKLHVYPKRDHIGFNAIHLAEEGRGALGGEDDYEIHLTDAGFAGQQFMHGMSNNEYDWRPWHLPERNHVTNWIARTASRAIKLRDPVRPGFWHVGFTHPHPPLVPLQSYVDRYADAPIAPALSAEWSAKEPLPLALQIQRDKWAHMTGRMHDDAHKAVYALSTHIDHQIRIIIGTLRDEGLLNTTIILFCADHGDMLGDFGIYTKRVFYEPSAGIPMILSVPAGSKQVEEGSIDDRLVCLQDVMPTLLDLCDVDIPATCTGRSMVSGPPRQTLYGEFGLAANATRMLRDQRFKLIWYPFGNRVQLFDLQSDPNELDDLADDPRFGEVRARLVDALIGELYGEDLDWVVDGGLNGPAEGTRPPADGRSLGGQRGLHHPAPPCGVPGSIFTGD